ncbi:MAG: stalk domain-containing protein [Defluviitaleaceae bacterium]|nr:stalk domain-containing protein [Defluviitaleaceae bacterium]
MKRCKHVLITLAAAILLALVPITVQASAINVTIDGVRVNFPGTARPQNENGQILVPIRPVFEALGFEVGWDRVTQTDNITRGEEFIRMTLGQSQFYTHENRVWLPKQQSFVGESILRDELIHWLEAPVQSIDGYIMVPIQRPLEAMGYYMDWNAATRTVEIETSWLWEPGRRLPARIFWGSEMRAWRANYTATGSAVDWEYEVVRLTNIERAAHGMPPLQVDPTLMMAARFKSESMHYNRYFAHSGVYGSPSNLARAFGFLHGAGENIAGGYSSPEVVVRAWMNSPGHRANMLSGQYVVMGAGYYNGYWTQLFSDGTETVENPEFLWSMQLPEGFEIARAGHFADSILLLSTDGVLLQGSQTEPLIQVIDNVAELYLNRSTLNFTDGSTFVLTKDGALYGWGRNHIGQLGDGTTTDRNRPVHIMDNVASVSSSGLNTAVITNNGALYVWGANPFGQIGDGTTGIHRNHPVRIMDNVASIPLAGQAMAVITNEGHLYMWGRNYSGNIGNGTTTHQNRPVRIMENVSFVTGFDHITMAITHDNVLWSWGLNRRGELGDGTAINRHSPIRIMDNVERVVMRNSWSPNVSGMVFAKRTDGTLWHWGGGDDLHFPVLYTGEWIMD